MNNLAYVFSDSIYDEYGWMKEEFLIHLRKDFQWDEGMPVEDALDLYYE